MWDKRTIVISPLWIVHRLPVPAGGHGFSGVAGVGVMRGGTIAVADGVEVIVGVSVVVGVLDGVSVSVGVSVMVGVAVAVGVVVGVGDAGGVLVMVGVSDGVGLGPGVLDGVSSASSVPAMEVGGISGVGLNCEVGSKPGPELISTLLFGRKVISTF